MNVSITKILCPVDFSENAEHAMAYGISLAKSYDAKLVLLHVLQMPWPIASGDPMLPEVSADVVAELRTASERELQSLEERVREEHAKVDTMLVTGTPFLEIIRLAKERDIELIVLGTHGRSGLAHVMMGSVSEKVVRKAPCPVLTVKHPTHEFVMP